jgi:hypothetical protein
MRRETEGMAKGKWQRAKGKWFSVPFEICRLPFAF